MSNVTESLNAYQIGLGLTYSTNELDDAINELEKLQTEKSSLDGVKEALSLLKGFSKKKFPKKNTK
jgi:hypothetical protein